MKLLHCPINGLRPISEFVYGGEYRELPDPQQASDQAWSQAVLMRHNAPGVKREWWYHWPSGTWLIAMRNSATDEIQRTCLFSEMAAVFGLTAVPGDASTQGDAPQGAQP